MKPDDELIKNMLTTIVGFIQETKAAGSVSFGVLYRRLAAPENHIGLRKGLIPIYLAAVFHEFKQELILQDRFGQVSITADTLLERERHFCTVLLVGSGARNMSMRNADGSSDLGTTTSWLRRPMTSIMTRD